MDVPDIPAEDPEQKWIAKYRKAMDEVAVRFQRTRNRNLRGTVANMYGLLNSKFKDFLWWSIHPAQPKPVTIGRSVTGVPKFAIPSRSIPHEVGKRKRV